MRFGFVVPYVTRSAAVVLAFVAAASVAGCSKSERAQARSRDAAPKVVAIETVRQTSVRRTLEVVGTLAAEDEVTVSSQAEGVVRRVLADLGDAVQADQPLVELDREKLQYSLDQQKAE